MFLGELKQPVSDLPGIGSKASADLASQGVISVADLVRRYPVRYEDRKNPVPLIRSNAETPALTVARVLRQDTFPWKKGRALKVLIEDDTAQASMICFGRNFLAGKLPPGKEIRIAGPFERNKYGELQSSAFVFEDASADAADFKEFGRILPVYPLGGGLNQSTLRRAIEHALNVYAHSVRSELPPTLTASRGIPSKSSLLNAIHFPDSLKEAQTVREHLIFEELFHLQVTVARKALSFGLQASRPWSGRLIEELKTSLPFTLTPDQETSLEEISSDITSGRRMNRLLQGEVGSGKTLVAFMAALGVIAAGRQAAFMAPTELLARQHADKAAQLLAPIGVRVAFLTGEVSRGARGALTRALGDGEVDLAVGTHALFSSDIRFRDLGLAIIDEQHRFGVQQRRTLTDKAGTPDVLALSATPIPRTLALTAFGDMDVSSIRTMPAGRLPIETHLARMGNEDKVYSFVRRELENGRRAYFVYPLIEESDKTALKDAETMYARLSNEVFPGHSGALLHSRVPEEDKRRIMERFRTGEITYLAATSVVEVGVDVPEATCMVVEHAERFGLSALHQLRGRVGRGKDASYCFLVYAHPLTDEGKRRMMTMKNISDGFILAEEDLKMRGPGDMAGVKQSGFLRFTIADPVRDINTLLEARDIAKDLITQDPGLLGAGMKDLRELLETAPPFNANFMNAG